MSTEFDLKVLRLEERERQRDENMKQVWIAINTLIEAVADLKGGENNAVVEGDEIERSNGKANSKKAHRS